MKGRFAPVSGRVIAMVGVLLGGCSKMATSGEAVPLAEVSISPALKDKGTLEPPICAKKGNGVTYYVDGYAHWPDGNLCYNEDCGVHMYQQNRTDGAPLRGADLPSGEQAAFVGYVPLVAQLGKQIDEPKLNDAKIKLEGVRGNGSKAETGVLERDSLALHLSDGSKVNNLVKIRAFFKVVDRNGVCHLAYAGGVKAP